MTRKLFYYLPFIVAVVWGNGITGQNLNPLSVTNVVPPSPEVAAFAKYVDMPVGYSTGVPEISIPIYTAKNSDLQAAIGLSYNASGIKVTDAATWVGLGWNLNYGGSVSRVVRGQPDDYSTSGYMYTTKTIHYTMSLPFNSPERFNILFNNAQFGELDVEPDVYIFSAMGYSGKFYYSQDSGKFLLSPSQRIRIEHTVDGNNKIIGFCLTLANGVKCYFGRSQDASRTAYETFGASQITNVTGGTASHSPAGNTPAHITSWQLMDMVNPSGKSIKFYYTNYSATDFGRGGETTDHAAGTGCVAATGEINTSNYENYSTKSRIQKISTDAGDVFFIPSQSYRQDAADFTYYLDSIKIKDKAGNLLKAFVFGYTYTTSADVGSAPGLGSFEQVARKRLYLMSLTEVSKTGTTLPAYEFTYIDPGSLPSRLSTSQDYWGYYNGKNNGAYLTPKVSAFLVYGFGNGYLSGSNRTIDTVKAKAGTLNKIKYPTGGTSEYFYESNVAEKAGANALINGYELSGLIDNMFFFYKGGMYQDPFNPNEYNGTITIPANVVENARLVTNYENCPEFNSFECPFQTTITGITDPGFYLYIGSPDFYWTLPPGQYAIHTSITIFDPTDPVPDFNVSVWWKEDPAPINLLVGGLRVRKIVNADATGKTITKTLSYNQFSTPGTSSGELVNLPVHAFRIPCGNGSIGVLRIVSNSELPLSSLDGQIIRYTNITEYSDENKTSFKTELTFTNDHFDYIVPAESNFPFPTNVQRDWRSSLLVNKAMYEKLASPGSYRILAQEKYFYQNYASLHSNEFGIRISPYPTANSFGYTLYNFTTEWYLPDSVVNETYSYTGGQNVLTTTTKNFYNSRYALGIVRTKNSKGQIIYNKTWYPYDYANVSGYNFNDLFQKYILDAAVRTETSNAGKLVGGQVIKYDVNGNPVTTYAYEYAGLRDTVAHNINTVIPQYYEPKTTIAYTVTNEVNNVTTNNLSTAYLWDYAGTYPIASAINCTPADMAYTSFESTGVGNWTIGGSQRISGDAITGSKYYQLSNGAVSKTSLGSGVVYIVSYWTQNSGAFSITGTQGTAVLAKTVGSWNCFIHKVTGVTQVTFSGTGLIDEVRLYPAAAQMTTYTYDPLVGMTSQCDVNNHIVYYEYDEFLRLKIIRDQDKNIAKTFEYKYQEQQ